MGATLLEAPIPTHTIVNIVGDDMSDLFEKMVLGWGLKPPQPFLVCGF
jgi:hypothetical protein